MGLDLKEEIKETPVESVEPEKTLDVEMEKFEPEVIEPEKFEEEVEEEKPETDENK